MAQTFESYKLYFQHITGIATSRSTSDSAVLRGSSFCFLYYRILCHFRSGLSATVIKEYCIVLYCIVLYCIVLYYLPND